MFLRYNASVLGNSVLCYMLELVAYYRVRFDFGPTLARLGTDKRPTWDRLKLYIDCFERVHTEYVVC